METPAHEAIAGDGSRRLETAEGTNEFVFCGEEGSEGIVMPIAWIEGQQQAKPSDSMVALLLSFAPEAFGHDEAGAEDLPSEVTAVPKGGKGTAPREAVAATGCVLFVDARRQVLEEVSATNMAEGEDVPTRAARSVLSSATSAPLTMERGYVHTRIARIKLCQMASALLTENASDARSQVAPNAPMFRHVEGSYCAPSVLASRVYASFCCERQVR